MAAFSDYLEDAILNMLFKNTAFTELSAVYIGLHGSAGADETTAAWAATEFDSATELNYARVGVAAASWDTVTGGLTANTNDVEFPVANSAWGTVTHVSFWDAATDGNLLFHAELVTSKVIASSDTPTFFAGNLNVQLQ